MNISSKNPFALLYNFTYGKLPNDLCSLFWGTWGAIVLFPFTLIGTFSQVWVNRICTGNAGKIGSGIWTVVVYFVLFVVGGAFLTERDAPLSFALLSFLTYPLIAIVVLTLMFALGGGIAFLIIRVSEGKTPDVVQNTKDWVGAIRRKHCTKITWK